MRTMTEIARIIGAPEAQVMPGVCGRWHSVQIRPDLASGEVLNLGVAFVDEASRVHLRVARDLSRLTCLYGEHVDVRSFEELASLVEEAFNGCRLEDFKLSKLTPHASLSEGRFAAGTSIGEILTSFYEVAVPIGRPHAKASQAARSERARTISTKVARESVIERLLQRMGPRVKPYIAHGPWVVHEPGGQEHRVELPIRAPGKVSATIVSLWAKDEFKRKYQLTKAGLDLGTIQSQSGNERLGLFVMRPMAEQGYTKEDLDQIDDEIDEASWQLRKVASIEVDQAEDAEGLSERIAEWLGAQAA